MIRNLKTLGLAFCAVFMFGALLAPSAPATTDIFTSEVSDTYVTGTQIGGINAENVFATKWAPDATVSCGTGNYVGTFTGFAALSVEITSSYTGCLWAKALPTTIDDEGCKYVLNGLTEEFINTEGQVSGEDATVSLNCEHAGQIRITGPLGCRIIIKDTHSGGTVNQIRQGVKYDNELDTSSNKWDVKVTVTIDKLTYTSNSACLSLGITPTDSDGFLTSTVILKGYADAEHSVQQNFTVS